MIRIIKVGDCRCSIRKSWHRIVSRSRKKNLKYLTFDEFKKWYNSQKKICHYCGVEEESIEKIYKYLKNNATKKLTIDRKNNNKGYVIGNLALACIRCNSFKGNRLTENGMKAEARKILC